MEILENAAIERLAWRCLFTGGTWWEGTECSRCLQLNYARERSGESGGLYQCVLLMYFRPHAVCSSAQRVCFFLCALRRARPSRSTGVAATAAFRSPHAAATASVATAKTATRATTTERRQAARASPQRRRRRLRIGANRRIRTVADTLQTQATTPRLPRPPLRPSPCALADMQKSVACVAKLPMLQQDAEENPDKEIESVVEGCGPTV